ncbi:MAG: hypothetical protein WAN36_04870 [Calditrichia bacterium]
MLDKVIDNIIEKIRAEVVSPQMHHIPLSYLMTRKVPDSVKHFFNQEVEIWLREEDEKFSSSDRFDYDVPEVRMRIDEIFDVLKQNATFHITKFNQLLERAIKLHSNYLIRPHWTLTHFLFKDSMVITTIEVYDMLKYFDKFQYYKTALSDYFNLKYMQEISQQQFEDLISGIDKRVFGAEPVETTIKTVKAILNFINEGRSNSQQIPLDVLEEAFRDRNLTEYTQLIKDEKEDGFTEITLKELDSLLRSGQTRLQREVYDEVSDRAMAESLTDIETDQPQIDVEDITVKNRLQPVSEEEPEEEDVIEEEEQEEELPVETESATAADQLAEVVSEKIKGTNLEDLNKIITVKQKRKFVRKIFAKNEYRYRTFIKFINNVPTWKRASAAIDEMFYQTDTNPYSKIALEFSDLIYNRFFPKDRPRENEFRR